MDFKNSSSNTLPKRILSIQSHVVSGYVGNRAAVLPLQLLGYEVDVINSVQFSNHTGYPSFNGKDQVLSGTQLENLHDGLTDNCLQDYDYVLTGYIGSETFLSSVLKCIQSIQETTNPKIKYICDPVLGDNGKLYVPAELGDIYRTIVVPKAFMVTPNMFELEILAESTINNSSDASKALKKIANQGPDIVVLTSGELKNDPNNLCCMALVVSKRNKNTKEVEIAHLVSGTIPKINSTYTGTGDVTAALLLAYCDYFQTWENASTMQQVLSTTMATIEVILQNTEKKRSLIRKKLDIQNKDGTNSFDEGNSNTVKALNVKMSELALVESRLDIINAINNPPSSSQKYSSSVYE